MKVSYFETAHYLSLHKLPAQWPAPPDAYDRETGAQSYRGVVEWLQYVETLGFDWVSEAEHHYSPHRLTPQRVSICAIARSGWPAQSLIMPLTTSRAKPGLSASARSTSPIIAPISSPN